MLPKVIVIQLLALAAVRGVMQPAGVALIVTSPVPPLAVNSWLEGEIVKMHVWACTPDTAAPANNAKIHQRRRSIRVENPLWHRLLRRPEVFNGETRDN